MLRVYTNTPTLECGYASTPYIVFDIQAVERASAGSAGPPAGGAGPVGGGHATGADADRLLAAARDAQDDCAADSPDRDRIRTAAQLLGPRPAYTS